MLMKFSKLLVLGVLSLFGLSAQAAIVDGVRQHKSFRLIKPSTFTM